ncbi:MAG: lamin tail domain-containing protein, partial [Firmicutes bacterium]|nr:lamin tail domain-containing protein [Bacillota bacterium]
MKKNKVMAIWAVIAVLGVVFCGCDAVETGTGGAEHTGGAVYITEVVSKNQSVLADEDGDYSDYIELYNSSSGRVALKGYYLSDSENNPQKWALPNIYIEARSYLIIFASGKNRSKDGYYHTNFALSASAGETVTLVGSDGSYASKLTLTACPMADIAYGMVQEGSDEGKYMWFAQPSPGQKNSGSYAPSIDELEFDTVDILINEYVIKNETVIYDRDGDYSDFIELYNPGSEAVELSGMYLSDDPADPGKWRIPEGVSIEAGGYIIIYASGKDKKTDSEVHASFKLSSTDGGIVLSDSRLRRIDSVPMVALEANVAYGRAEDGSWKYFPRPTPGAANSTPSFETLSASRTPGEVYIEEVSATPPGSSSNNYDYITLYNSTDKPVSLAGCGLAKSQDKKY